MLLPNIIIGESARKEKLREKITDFVSKHGFPFSNGEAKKRMSDGFEAKRNEAVSEKRDFEPTADNLMRVYKELKNSVCWKRPG
jgi:menaquinone-dependent protoporphyrinogen IX oxidase